MQDRFGVKPLTQFNSSSLPLLSTTPRLLQNGCRLKITGLLMPFLVLNLIRLLTCSHSSETAPPIVHAERLGSQCRNYGQSCGPSLAWACCQHSPSLQSGPSNICKIRK